MCWVEGVGWDGVEMHGYVRVCKGVCEGAVHRVCVYVLVAKQQPSVSKQERVHPR